LDVELHERIASVLYPFGFVFISIAFLGSARTNRQSRSQSLTTAFALAAGLRLVAIAASNMFALNAAAGVLVYGLPIGAIAFSLYSIRSRA
jgi:lipopolysaccharide export system permease protein